MECHVKLAASYSFLRTDSHLDCYDYYRHEIVDSKKLIRWVESGDAQYLERLKDSDLKKMREAISKSKAIENDPKQATLNALTICLSPKN